MKIVLLVTIAFFSTQVSSQELEQTELNKIYRLGINTANIDNYDTQLTNDFREILRAERKRKVNKTMGIILSSLSAVSLGVGTAVITTPSESMAENVLADITGGFLIVTGVIEGGFGIPLLLASNKRKKQRDKLIQKYQNQLE